MNDGAAQTRCAGAEGPRQKRARSGPLSKREREVFELLADGLSGAQIAERTVLSPQTVRNPIRNAMSKLDASPRSQAVEIALQRRETSPRAEDSQPPATQTQAPLAADPAPSAAGEDVKASLEEVMNGL